jgi:hypothetical protein
VAWNGAVKGKPLGGNGIFSDDGSRLNEARWSVVFAKSLVWRANLREKQGATRIASGNFRTDFEYPPVMGRRRNAKWCKGALKWPLNVRAGR